MSFVLRSPYELLVDVNGDLGQFRGIFFLYSMCYDVGASLEADWGRWSKYVIYLLQDLTKVLTKSNQGFGRDHRPPLERRHHQIHGACVQ